MTSTTEKKSENKMEYVRLGNSGLKVSKICLGLMSYGEKRDGPDFKWTWSLGEKETVPFIKRALELGINFFDTADVYQYGSSEEICGKALWDHVKRDEVVLATKVFSPMSHDPNNRGLSRKHIMQACNDSLRRLGTDYIDLYQIHRWDYDTPIEETMEALNDLVRSGKVRYIGASSMYAWQFAKAQHIAETRGWAKFISMQNFYNLIYREEEREMIPLCKDLGVGLIPWSPLASGLLCKRPQNRDTQRATTDPFIQRLYIGQPTQANDDAVINRVVDLAEKKGVSPASLALAWLLKKGVTAPIIGATKMQHLEDAVAAVHITLTAEDVNFLEELYVPHKVMVLL